jgi:xanthine dehydrogenase accessory factor
MIVNTINNLAPLGGNHGVIAIAERLLQNNERFALVIVISTQGSTYRKPGALALVAENGTTQSVISGGCLEPTLQDAARLALRENRCSTLLLDTSTDDDLLFGSGSGCRGKMRVMLIPVAPRDTHPIYQVITTIYRNNLDQNYRALTFALAFNQSHCGQGAAWTSEQQWSFGALASETTKFREAPPGEHATHIPDIGNVEYAVFTIAAPRRLLIIGAGVEAPYLIRLTRAMGWHTTVIDHREQQLALHADDADVKLCARPNTVSNNLREISFDAALIMSHSASVDLEALQMMALRSEPYVGLLGPPARRDELLSQLTDLQRNQLSNRLHAPLGLKLGGDGPESLALSITAELQGVFHHG